MLKKLLSRSVSLRYLIPYFAVLLAVFAGIVVYVSDVFDKAIQESVLEHNTNRLGLLRVEHEKQLSTLLSICDQLSLSPQISSFKFTEKPMEGYYIKQQLSAFQVANNFCDQFYITFHEDSFLYSSTTSVSMELFSNRFIQYEKVSSQELKSLLCEPHSNPVILPAQNIRNVPVGEAPVKMLSVIMPLRLNGKYSIGNILFLVQDNTYQQMFADEIPEERAMYIIQDRRILESSRQDVPDELILEEVYSQKESFVRELTVEGENYLLFVQPGNLLDIRYASLIPQRTVRQQAMRSKLNFGLFLLILIIPASLSIIYFTRRHILRPMRELQRSVGAESGGDGFASIRSGIEALIGQNRDLHTRLDSSLLARRAEFVHSFVKGRFPTREEAIEAAARLELEIDRPCFAAAIISEDSAHKPEVFEALASRSEAVICYAELMAQEKVLFLVFGASPDELVGWAEQTIGALRFTYRDTVVAMSDPHLDFSEAGTAYLEAETAYGNRFLMDNEFVLYFSQINTAVENVGPLSQRFLDKFYSILQAGAADDGKALDGWINELMETMTKKKLSLFAFRMLVNDIANALLGRLSTFGPPPADTLQYYDIFNLSSCRSVRDMAGILRGICTEILKGQENHSAAGEPADIQRFTAYLKEHCTDPNLTIGSAAEAMGMNAAKVSTLYKEHTGMHPSAYLQSLRMDKAKELLRDSNLPIKEIAVKVGYFDSSSFIRRFRQNTSVTPAQYRQTARGQREEQPSTAE